ncbi:MAG: hypothetical protein ACREV3_08975 [Gammaproteobacteria bacterium]
MGVQTPFVKQRAVLAASTAWTGAPVQPIGVGASPGPLHSLSLILFNGSKGLAGEFVQVSDNPGQHAKHSARSKRTLVQAMAAFNPPAAARPSFHLKCESNWSQRWRRLGRLKSTSKKVEVPVR